LSSLFSLGLLDSVSVLGETRLPDSGWAVAALIKRENKQIAGTINFLIDWLEFDIKLLRGCQGKEAIASVCQLVKVPMDWTQRSARLNSR
jgi:hypothetical protein